MAQEDMSFEHIKSTDVMFVDLRVLEPNGKVQVLDVGEMLGFPGQILARVDPDHEILYGITIQNYSGFRRRLLWRYRMASMRKAVKFLVAALKTGLSIDGVHRQHPQVHA